jgi:hypothetical protein
MTRILGVLILVGTTGLASGSGNVCRTRVLRDHVVVQDQINDAKLGLGLINFGSPYIVQVPAYSTGFADGTQALSDRLSRLEAKIDLLFGPLNGNGQPGAKPAPEQLPPPGKPPVNGHAPPASSGGQHPAIGVFLTACVTCHDKAVSAKAGGGFSMMDGQQFLPWTVEQAGLVATRTYLKEMPTPRSGIVLTDQQCGFVQDFVNTLLKQQKATAKK